MTDQNEKVSVEEMVAAIEYARRTIRGDVNTSLRQVAHLNATRDYIIIAESRIADRDAQITTLRAENTEMLKVTGPKCPKCGRWLRADHEAGTYQKLIGFNSDSSAKFSEERGWWYDDSHMAERCVTAAELLSEYPTLAAEMGLTEAKDAK